MLMCWNQLDTMLGMIERDGDPEIMRLAVENIILLAIHLKTLTLSWQPTIRRPPWSYWLSSRNPHRPFDLDQGIKSGLDPEKVIVPPYLPDVPEVRSDICDYYLEVQDFDREVGEALELITRRGELENTIIIICGDNGWMMPRGLANLYDFGTRVPLIISWPK